MALAAAQQGWARWRARTLGPAAGACWIWSPHAPVKLEGKETVEPAAFYLFADVEIDTLPVAAEVLVAVDESYLLYVNGTWVGAGAYRPGAGLDAFDVTSWLNVGRNRIIIEGRASHGAGGVLAALINARTRAPLLVSNAGWRFVAAYDPILFEPPRPYAGGEAVRVWGVPPSGRWRFARTPVNRTPWFELGVAPEVQRPTHGSRVAAGARWRRIGVNRLRLPPGLAAPRTIFDFGRIIEGVPVIDFRGTSGEPALLGLASDLGTIESPATGDHYLLATPIAGSPYWVAHEPMRFRYLEVLGVSLELRPFALVVAAGVPIVEPAAVAADADGVFGMAPLWRPSRPKGEVIERMRRRSYSSDKTGSK